VVELAGTVTTADCFGSPSGEDVDNLIDGQTGTKFLAFGNSVWVRFDAGQPYVLARYGVTSANDFPDRDPRSWVLQGSNDRTSWTDIDVRIGEEFAGRFERREFEVTTDDFFRYYQLRMENQIGGVTQLAELDLHGERPGGAADAAPAAVDGLVATAVSRSEIELSWNDNSADEVLFRIEQSTDGTSFSPVAYAPADATGASIAELPAAALRHFRVVAANRAGDAAPSSTAEARTRPPLAGTANSDGSLRYSEGGYTLTVADLDPANTPDIMVRRHIDEFFVVYPQMLSRFNTGATRSVRVTYDPDYDGVAYADWANGRIVISSAWAASAPDDVDVITHEGFHIVQAYDNPNAPGWAIEGLADFARWRYGNHNAGSCWNMQRYQPGQNYTDAYGVTARFLLWIESDVRSTIATELDAALRGNQYSSSFWTTRTGRSVDALWAEYAAAAHDPVSYR
jgi:hypothetical protein